MIGKLFSWQRWSNPGTAVLCCPERLRDLHPWGYSNSNQTWPWANQQNFKADLSLRSAPLWADQMTSRRSLPPPLTLHFYSVSQLHGKWEVGMRGNSLLSKYSAALKSDSKGQIISWGKERNVTFYFHYHPLWLYSWVIFTKNMKS